MRRISRVLGVAALLLATCGLGAVPAGAAGSTAVVVIDTGGSIRSVTISFSGTITGVQALALAGANPATYGFSGQGLAVCALDGVGHAATADSCLGTPEDPRYWAYFRAPSGATGWSYARQGGGGSAVGDGDVEGWRFGTGAPPRAAVCDVTDCAPPAAPASPAPPSGGTAPAPTPAPGGKTSSPAGGAGVGTGVGPPAVVPGVPTGDAAAAATSPPTTVAPVPTGSNASTANGRSRGLGARALGRPPAGGDPGSGSPTGVLAAAGIVLAIGGAAVVLRRRGRAPG